MADGKDPPDKVSVDTAYFNCPICKDKMKGPIMTKCGHRFCKDCIKQSIDIYHKCPVCNTQLQRSDLITDHQFKCMIEDSDKAGASGTDIMEKCMAAMVLGGVGDALGYRLGYWEVCEDGKIIHQELTQMGGVKNIHVAKPKWIISDDTVMHLATAEALVENGTYKDKEKLYRRIARHYIDCMRHMEGRGAGITCINSTKKLQPDKPGGYRIPFDQRGGGCGGAMRAMCIGIRYNRPQDLEDLIAVSIESGRMTHHHPTGYLGSLAAALFTSYAIQDKSVRDWGKGLLDTLPKALKYVQEAGLFVEENTMAWTYFEKKWSDYLKLRGIANGGSDPKFPQNYDVETRDQFYRDISYAGKGGSSGHDAPMIAYDALLGIYNCAEKDRWEELCKRSMFHGGDSDSTGTIAACCYGALYGFKGVPENNYKDLEYKERLEMAGKKLCELSQQSKL